MSHIFPRLKNRVGQPDIVPILVEKDSGLDFEEIKTEIQKQTPDVIVWNPATEQDPAAEGNNLTRERLPFSHFHHPKGKILAGIKSKLLIGAIDFAHKAILKGYDMDAYVFDDPRLKAQSEHFRNYIKTNFQNAGYKIEFMNKIVDIIMFLRKEDIYYCRLFDMIETMPKFGLTETEKENIEKWH